MIIHHDKEKVERKKQLALKEMLWSLIRLRKDDNDDEIKSGFWYLCLITQSKGQARRILTQRGKNPEDYIIFEIKDEK